MTLHARISRVAYTWLGSTPRGYPTQRSPSYASSERSPPVYSPKGKGVMGLSPLALRVIARRVDSNATARSVPAAMLNWTSFRAFERGYVAEAPIRVFPRVGSAYKPEGYSSHPPNPLSSLFTFLSNQPLSLSLFNVVADTDSSQDHQ